MMLRLPVTSSFEVTNLDGTLSQYSVTQSADGGRSAVRSTAPASRHELLGPLMEVVRFQDLFAVVARLLRFLPKAEEGGAHLEPTTPVAPHRHAISEGDGARSRAASPVQDSSPTGAPQRPRAQSLTHEELVGEPTVLSPVMTTTVKRFMYLIECFFALHPVNDVSPYRTRQAELAMARLRDVTGRNLHRVDSTGSQVSDSVHRAPPGAVSTFQQRLRSELVRFVEDNAAVVNGLVTTEPGSLYVRAPPLPPSYSVVVRGTRVLGMLTRLGAPPPSCCAGLPVCHGPRALLLRHAQLLRQACVLPGAAVQAGAVPREPLRVHQPERAS